MQRSEPVKNDLPTDADLPTFAVDYPVGHRNWAEGPANPDSEFANLKEDPDDPR